MGQLVLSAAGAVVGGAAGFLTGGPAGIAEGAELGWMAGGIAGGLLFRQKGPQPADIRIQDSAYGKPIPLAYGIYRIAGNIIWAGQPYVASGGGKGAGGKGPQQQKVSMSFAVGLCAGPITAVRRIWANGKLIYDVSNPSNFQAISGSNQMVTNFTVYPGDEKQLPDPVMQAALGVNNTPAYRGLAYVVFNELDLSRWGNYLPSLSFEVITAPAALATSNSASTYTYSTSLGTFFMAPCLSASGGIAMGYGYYFGYNGVTVANLSTYGAVQTHLIPWSGNRGGINMPLGYSDVPGIYTWPGWLHPDGSYDDMSLTGSMDLGFGGDEACFWRNGTDLFLSSFYTTSGRPIYRCDLSQQGLIVAQSTQLGEWHILGGSATHVYAFDDLTGHLFQFDRDTLAVTATYTGINFNANTGYVLTDDYIYTVGDNLAVSLFRPSQNTYTVLGYAPFGVSTMVAINENFFVFASGANLSSISLGYMWISQGQTFTTLGNAVGDLCSRAGLSSARIDVSQLTDVMNGYCVTNHSTTRSNLGPLMSTYFFDACDSGGVIRFVKRGAQPVGTFLYADLGASPNLGDTANTTPITETIVQEVDLPRSMQLTYPELGDDYNPNTQRAIRAYTNSNRDTVMQVPIVLAGSDALARTQAMLWSAWVGRKTFQFTTGLAYLQYEPGDVMTLQGANDESWTVRITRCQYDGQGSLLWAAALEEPDIYPGTSYTTQGGTALGFASQQIDYSGPTILSVLDIPPLRDADSTPGVYVAACGMASSWPGAAIDLSRDDVTFTQFAQITHASVMGYAAGALSSFGGGNLPDEINTVSIVLYEGAIASCSYADFLAGANAAWLGGEIIFFRNATQTAANTWTLSGLLRGRGGTEAAMTTHAAGERFVLLDPAAIVSMPIQTTDFGSTLYFETFLLNLFSGSPGAQVSLMPKNGRVMPLSPVYFMAAHGSASSTADISLSWIRRARVRAQWLDGTDVPLDESAENYTLTILNGSTVVRTVTVAGNGAGGTWTYTSANITADAFSAGATITFRVQQNSDQGVLGTPATTTITR
ncbi:phage tail protein [Burkholderia diffusa]|uniref:phage tail protein n=1 Tax=Burkholderia diffusa TaxID=488732 RepID=UPI00075EE419|nr:phage tail protein [Burkholderia diffusa]KVG31458.1 hypothetical protein WJ30_14955 [Burkholderia diffusa]